MIAELHPESISQFIEARNNSQSNVRDDIEITDFVPLENDRIITLTKSGLIILWRFNVFKEYASQMYEIKIKRQVREGKYEDFTSLSICDHGHHLAIYTSFGMLTNRNKIFLAWVTDQDYIYLLTERSVFDNEQPQKKVKQRQK